MSVFRIAKNKNYTVMSNYHLRDMNISLKARGLMSLILSLPDNWDYTLRGLSTICKEGIDAIRAAVGELEKFGYIERHRVRNEKGQLANIEYVIHEEPILPSPTSDVPASAKPAQPLPKSENPTLVDAALENTTQINKDKQNKEIQNTDLTNYPSINQRADEIRWIDRYEQYKNLIKSNIDYDTLILNHDKSMIDEFVAIMTEVLTVDAPYYTIEGRQYPAEIVRKRFLEIDYNKLEAFLLDFSRRTDKIRNIKAYIITALFNVPATADTSLTNMVKNDMYGC